MSAAKIAPPQHPASLARKSSKAQKAADAASAPVQQVYTPGYTAVITVPKADIEHLPPASFNVTRLVLCANYARDGTCPHGNRCKFVHVKGVKLDADGKATAAPGSKAKVHEVHINYAWRNAEEVTYERFAPGKELRVAAPNSKTVIDVMSSEMALKTRALDDHMNGSKRPLTHCAHFYYNRACHLGEECGFVHAVFIDPSARKHQRAPAPSSLGRSSTTRNGKQQQQQQQHAHHHACGGCGGCGAKHVEEAAAPTPVAEEAHNSLLPACAATAVVRDESGSEGNGTPRSFGLSSQRTSPASVGSDSLAQSGCCTPPQMPEVGTVTVGKGRYRFDPYAVRCTPAATPLNMGL